MKIQFFNIVKMLKSLREGLGVKNRSRTSKKGEKSIQIVVFNKMKIIFVNSILLLIIHKMKKTKVIQLLQSCKSDELPAIERFLESPYYNEDEDVIRLFSTLRTFYPDFDAPGLTKKQIFRSVFPGTPYADKQSRYLLSRLNKLLEHYLAIRKIEQQPYRLPLALLESLSERGLKKAYRQINRRLEERSRSAEGKHSDFFLTQLRWSEIKEHHFLRQRLRRFDTNLQDLSEDLDKYYFLHRLKIACAMLDRQTIFQDTYRLGVSPDWIRHLEAEDFFEEAIIRIYYSIFQALRNEREEEHFRDLKRFLSQSLSLARPDLKDIYLFAVNYCARKIRQGGEAYVTEALQLYQRGIEQEILIDEKGLSPWAFTNVVKLALRLQHYEWIESFIQRYAPRLPETFRENALHYNLAELYYYTHRFDQAREHLTKVAYSDLNYYLGARVLLAKIYYETGEEEALLSLISSFTIFLKRNRQLSGDLKNTYLNFCQILFQIVRRSPRRMKQLQDKIDHSQLLTDRAWLQRIYEEAMETPRF